MTFQIGDYVQKVKGYFLCGEVRGTFYTKAGKERVVVEQVGSGGLLHIFPTEHLEKIAETSDEWPQSGDEYFFVTDRAYAISDIWEADSFDWERFDAGNVFSTAGEADAAAERVREALKCHR